MLKSIQAKKGLSRLALVFGVMTIGGSGLFVTGAAADTVGAITFEPSQGYSNGPINGQQGWSNELYQGRPYDANVVAVAAYPAAAGYGFGNQAFQISDALVTNDFGIQTHSPALADPSSEASNPHFVASFSIGTALAAPQPGSQVVVSPDDGNGARMSYLRFEEQADGVHVSFYDQQGSEFVKTNLETFPIGQAHTFTFDMTLNPGPGNDVVKTSRDGAVIHTGTSWEASYGSPIAISKLLFRVAGAPAYNADYLGKGYLFDNVTLSSGPLAPAPRDIKQAVLAELRAQALKPMDSDTAKKINEAIKHLTKSVNSTAWLDDSHLATKDFDPVFNEEKATIGQLEDIKSTSGISATTLQGWKKSLATADKALATIALEDWGDLPSTSAADLQKYNDELAKGDVEFNKGGDHYDAAIEHYKNAWKAIKP